MCNTLEYWKIFTCCLLTQLIYLFILVPCRNGNVYANFLDKEDTIFSQGRVLKCDGYIALCMNFVEIYLGSFSC